MTIERKLFVAGARLRQAKETRDGLIVQAYAEGLSLRVIADLVGLSHGGVKKIVER